MRSPTVSVIIPVFNGAEFLAEAGESVRAQNYAPTEIIVVDDGSTDDTAQVVQALGADLLYAYQPNQGPSAARNRGVALAHGDFLAFLDHDDYWVLEKLALQIDTFRRLPHLDAVFGQLQQTYTIQETEQNRLLFGLNAQDGYHLNTALIRREAFHRVGPFSPTWTIDSVEWLWRARHSDLCIEVLPQVLAWRRIHGGNLSIRARSRIHAEYLRLTRQVLAQKRDQSRSNGTV